MTPRKVLSWVVAGFYAALLLSVALETGCKRSSSTSPEKVANQRLAWNLQTTVEAYDKIGVKNAHWDESARKCLAEFARTRCAIIPSDEPAAEIISTNVAAAVDAGCTDPMVNYLFIKFAMPQTSGKEAFAKRFYAVFQQMNASAYPPIRKFYATARALDQYYYTYGSNAWTQAAAEMTSMQDTLYQNVGEIMGDKTIPSDEASEATDLALYLVNGDSKNKEDMYQTIIAPLSKNLSGDYLPWYLKGNHEIEMAWGARGSGYAGSVSKEGWKEFGKNLAVARESLEHAWKLDPKQSKIAIQMMTVVLGQGGDRKEMEIWFNRAMEIDTNSYDACRNKMNFLDPKWYGTDEEQLAFGRECGQSTKWGGHVPLILVLAHNSINLRLEGAAKSNYWKQPEVWSDLQTAYDRFFELNPDETRLYQDYTRFAYRAEQWDKLKELIPKLATTNYEFFGGKSAFDKMIRLANEHK